MITPLRTPVAVLSLVGLLASGAGFPAAGSSGVLDPPVLLPDGTEFRTWEDVTEYKRVYYVDQQPCRWPRTTIRGPKRLLF